MGAQGRTPQMSDAMQRVKVYRLNEEGKWDDRGTGHVTIDYLERSEDLGLFVIDEEDNDTLLLHRICSDDIYRRQEDTIISWRDPELSTELALSFQESMGCSYIWDQICSIQRNMQFNTLGSMETGPRPANDSLDSSNSSHANDDSFNGISKELREIPPVELSNLPSILKMVVEGSATDQMHAVEHILQEKDFFQKLMDLFRMSEDVENVDDLHLIFKLVKGIILLNSLQILEKVFCDEYIMDVIGTLEYDPEIPNRQRHRVFLKEHVVFKEAIPIKSPTVLSKIHQTYRIGYIKDVILPRILDEAVVANINAMIHSNNNVVVSLLKDDTKFIQELFSRLTSSDISADSKKNLVSFLHDFCSLGKSLQLVQQVRLFRDLINEGLFDIVAGIFQSGDKPLILTGTDILLILLNHDPNLLRAYITQQEGNGFLGLLVKGMTTDFGEDMHCQFLEIFRILLDSYSLAASQQKDTILEIFYESHMDQLIDVIASSCPPKVIARTVGKGTSSGEKVSDHVVTKPEILANICELLCFCVQHHPYRIKCSFLHNNAIEKILSLIRRKEKYVVVAAVRFLRTVISRNDDALLRHIVKNGLLKPVVDAFVGNGDRYNLFHSAVLDLFDYIRRENLKSLITYSIECLWDQLEKFCYIDTFKMLKVKHEQSLENGQAKTVKSPVVDPRKRPDERAIEKEEEDYFNGDSDEEDSASAPASSNRDEPTETVSNGTSTSAPSSRSGSVGLVDYEDDEDEDDSALTSNRCVKQSSESKSTLKQKLLDTDGLGDEELPPSKRPRLNEKSDNGSGTTVATCLTCSPSDLPAVVEVPPVPHPSHDENGHLESSPKENDDIDVVPMQTSRDTHPNCEDCLVVPHGNLATTELAASGAKVANSEPYPVR